MTPIYIMACVQNAHYKLWAKDKQLITVYPEAKSSEREQTEASDAGDGMRHANGRDKGNEVIQYDEQVLLSLSSVFTFEICELCYSSTLDIFALLTRKQKKPRNSETPIYIMAFVQNAH